MDRRLRRILPKVQKPARYTGGEYNQIIKDKSEDQLRMALCFPDTYEIGMSNLGMKILYGSLNAIGGIWCERVFSPWVDMEDEMRKENIPLWALESGDPLTKFDAIGFSIGYEMSYTSVLNMLDLAGIPIRREDRGETLLPLVFAGGMSCCNPEPIADFFDLLVIGEGEEVAPQLLLLLRQAKADGLTKDEFLHKAAKLKGIYVPSFYEPSYSESGTLDSFIVSEGAPNRVEKRIVTDFENSFFPISPPVPSTEIVHDRVILELFRGCIRGCRFCQAGHISRPVRSKSPEKLVAQGIDSLRNTGYQEITLSSLSSSDYEQLGVLCDSLLSFCALKNISLSLPSLRADSFSMGLMSRVQKVRKSGLTFAPEAGTQRLRDAINKNVTEEDLLNSCKIAFQGGWSSIKLYFMLGLPTETDEDVLGIAELAKKVLALWKDNAKNKAKGLRITISTSCFVPKPHTPFQWEAQIPIEEYMRRVALLRENMRQKSITYNWHDADLSFVEAVLARGDRRLGAVIEEVWRKGAKLDSWSEHFSFSRWMDAFESCGIDPRFYACREREPGETFPWDHINMGLSRLHLWRERELSRKDKLSPDCSRACTGCGAVSLMGDGRSCDG